ncbi:MAG: monovalent cation/H(+) antiporter subunit G [Chloroflexota bacterium]
MEMETILQGIGSIFLIIGVLFSVVGVVGVLRLPDTYTRLHASGKTSTLGVLFICLGTAFFVPSGIAKLAVLSIFIIFSGPVGSHAIAAGLHRGVAVHNTQILNDGDPTNDDQVITSGVHESADEIRAIAAAAQAAAKAQQDGSS